MAPNVCLFYRLEFVIIAVIAAPKEVLASVEPARRPSYHSDDSNEPGYDYTERRTLPITIRDYSTIQNDVDKFVVGALHACTLDQC